VGSVGPRSRRRTEWSAETLRDAPTSVASSARGESHDWAFAAIGGGSSLLADGDLATRARAAAARGHGPGR